MIRILTSPSRAALARWLLIVVPCVVAFCPARAAVDMYLEIEGIEGESQADQHKNDIDVLSFSWGVSQSGSTIGGGGGGAGKATFSDLSCVKRLDKASPKLALACATGSLIPVATLICKESGTGREYYRITLNEVFITSVAVGGSTAEDRPTESLSLNFTKITWEYFPVGADGSPEPPIRTEFDLRTATSP